MTKTIAIAAAALFTAGAQAADSYQQFTAGNPDSSNPLIKYEGVTAVQPGVGSDVDRYQGIGRGNSDLFDVDLDAAFNRESERSERPNIYGPFGGSPDLSY
jgi:predicted membrane-bound mannosyltransferase